jgi:hypothetical protein
MPARQRVVHVSRLGGYDVTINLDPSKMASALVKEHRNLTECPFVGPLVALLFVGMLHLIRRYASPYYLQACFALSFVGVLRPHYLQVCFALLFIGMLRLII